MSTAANYVAMTLSGTPGTGTATLLAALSSPDQSFLAAYGAVSTTVDVEWYSDATTTTRLGCERNVVYNGGSPGTLTRGTPETPGSLVSLPAGASVRVVLPASSINNYERALSAVIPGGRLTLESGVPVSTTDQTAKTSIFYTPFVHNVVPLWNGSDWVPTTFTEVTQALGTLTSGRPYDVFGFLNGSALNTEILAWTNDTTRATAVTLQDGRYCKSGDKTRLLLGTFYTTSTTTTADSATTRYVCNVYNRISRALRVSEAASSWSYASSTWRSANNSTTNRVAAIFSVPNININLLLQVVTGIPSGGAGQVGIGEDTTSSVASEFYGRYVLNNNNISTIIAIGGGGLSKMPAVGVHYYQWVESSEVGTTSFYGTSAASPPRHISGITGEVAL